MTKVIGIDGSRAFIEQRTGIEEYSYQVIKSLRNKLKDSQVILYLRKGQKVDFDLSADEAGLPKKWKIKILRWPRFWTQLGLSLEMLLFPVDVLFIPAHTAPFIHPKKTFVVVHGIEYEIIKEAYSAWEKFYMRHSIKLSCKWAKKIISVSKSTKKDLVELYEIPEKKIEIIYEGVNKKQKTRNNEQYVRYKPYLLFVGRLGERKNVQGIISAFEILKEKYQIPHKLVLVGKAGFGYEKIKEKIERSKYGKEIIELGFVSQDEKENLMAGADIFVFTTFYEGFGLPILEAQILGVPVVTSNVSSLPEVGADSVAYATPTEPKSIADSIYKIISDDIFRNAIIKKGNENVKRFSWEKCASSIAELLNG